MAIGIEYIRKAEKELEALGYQPVRTHTGPWHVIGVKQGCPVRCVQIKRTRTALGVKQLIARFTPQNQPSGLQPYRHELWIYQARVGWIKS